MQTLVDDLQHAVRRVRAQRWTAIAAGSMLTLAIGITWPMLTIVDHMPLDDLPEFYTPLTLGAKEGNVGLRYTSVCPDETAIRERVRATNPHAIVFSVQPLHAAYAEQLARPRAAFALGVAFAVVSLIAAAGGLFSVLSYAVGRRRREFGIRAAMGGAQRREIGRLVLADGLSVTACRPCPRCSAGVGVV